MWDAVGRSAIPSLLTPHPAPRTPHPAPRTPHPFTMSPAPLALAPPPRQGARMPAADPLPSDPPVPDPLTLAPALAFFAVATADGSLDAAEIGRFRSQLDAGGEYGSLFAAALGRLAGDAGALDAATEAAGEAVLTGGADAAWGAIRAALDGESEKDAARFVADVTAFARGIAEAAGGLYDVGPQVSDEEDAAVGRIAAALGAG